MERKTFEAGLKALNGEGTGLARIAMLGPPPDRDNDILEPGVLGGQEVTAPLLVGHRWDRLPAGKAVVGEQDGALVARFKLNMELDAGRALHSALAFDLATPPSKMEWSFGYLVKEAESGLHEGQRIRRLRRIELIEVSPVIKGAGRETATLAIKADEDLAARTAEAVEQYEKLRERGVALVEAELESLACPELGGGTHRYRLTAFPPGDLRHRLVHDAVKAACAELGIEPPSVLFFATAYSGDRADFATPQKVAGITWHKKRAIGLYVVQGPDELRDTIRHECGHLAGLSEEQCARFAGRGAKLLAPAPYRPTLGHAIAMAWALRARGMSAKEIRRTF